MQIRSFLAVSASVAALSIPGVAFAQSTGSVDFEEEDVIVVEGTRTTDVVGIQAPDLTKAKAVLTQE